MKKIILVFTFMIACLFIFAQGEVQQTNQQQDNSPTTVVINLNFQILFL